MHRHQQQPLRAEVRAAHVLNNVAISLQLRYCHKQALATFQDAVYLTKIATVQQHKESAPDVQQMTHRAFQRLSKPEPCKKKGLCTSSLDSISDSDDVSDLFQTNSTSTALLIRFDETETSHRDADLDTAIILQNYGLCCLHNATLACSTKEGAGKKFIQNAFRLLQLAHTIAFSALQSYTINEVQDHCESSHVLHKILLVTVCSTKNMALEFSSSSQSSNSNNATKLQQCLESLKALETVSKELGILREDDHSSRPVLCAAAA